MEPVRRKIVTELVDEPETLIVDSTLPGDRESSRPHRGVVSTNI